MIKGILMYFYIVRNVIQLSTKITEKYDEMHIFAQKTQLLNGSCIHIHNGNHDAQ